MSFECASCGERKQLRGQRDGETVQITCRSCGYEWRHDPWACPTCGGRLHPVRKPLVHEARGTQQSIIGFRVAKECARCDPEEPKAPGWLSAT
jgi:hypothetical protein